METLVPQTFFYGQYTLDDGTHAAYYEADRLEWDEEKGFLRVYKGEILVGAYDLGILQFGHIRRGK